MRTVEALADPSRSRITDNARAKSPFAANGRRGRGLPVAPIGLRVCLLGPPRFALGESPFELNVRPKTLPLLCSLLLHRDGLIPRAALAFALWPDDDEETARTNLRRHLHYLVRALPAGPEPWIITSRQNVAWNSRARPWLDVDEFEWSIVSGDPAKAVELYRGDLLDGWYDESLRVARDRLRHAYLAALTDLFHLCREVRDFRAAADHARRLLRADPWREDIVRGLMSVRYAGGDRAGALAEFDRFARLLRAEMNAAPMPETVALREALVDNKECRQVATAASHANDVARIHPLRNDAPADQMRASLAGGSMTGRSFRSRRSFSVANAKWRRPSASMKRPALSS
jgi:DNA-binding SARP family transcriptional activator